MERERRRTQLEMKTSLRLISRLSYFRCLTALVLVTLSVQAQTRNASRGETFTHPAEFEKQEAVWIGARPFENGHPTLDIVIQMVKILAPHVRIKLMVADDAAKTNVQRLLEE